MSTMVDTGGSRWWVTVSWWTGWALMAATLTWLGAAATVLPTEQLEPWNLTVACAVLAVAAMLLGFSWFERKPDEDDVSISPHRRAE